MANTTTLGLVRHYTPEFEKRLEAIRLLVRRIRADGRQYIYRVKVERVYLYLSTSRQERPSGRRLYPLLILRHL
jgi:hypothetical protein